MIAAVANIPFMQDLYKKKSNQKKPSGQKKEEKKICDTLELSTMTSQPPQE